MRLKILFVPFSILLVLILAIGYIKPDITTLEEKRVLLDTKISQSQNMATLLANIDTLVASLDEQSASEESVHLFLPKTEDQERVVDMFNYLASQSGVFVNVMGMNQIEMTQVEEEPVLPPANSLLVTGVDSVSAVPVVSALKPKVQSYSAQVEVKGGYENISDFFNRLAHMNRYHKILKFSLTAPVSPKEGEENMLTGIFESQFDYFPVQQVASALQVPVFTTGTFDAAALTSLLSWVNYTVPPLTLSETGRPNPFQP